MNTADTPKTLTNENSTDDNLAFLIREPAEVYHRNAANFLSSHFLADFRKCPLLYHRKRCGLIPDQDRPGDGRKNEQKEHK